MAKGKNTAFHPNRQVSRQRSGGGDQPPPSTPGTVDWGSSAVAGGPQGPPMPRQVLNPTNDANTLAGMAASLPSQGLGSPAWNRLTTQSTHKSGAARQNAIPNDSNTLAGMAASRPSAGSPNWSAVNANRQNLQTAISHGAVSSGLGFVPKANDANTLAAMGAQSAINSRRTPTSSDRRQPFIGGLAGTGGATATSPRPVSQGGMAGWGGAAAGSASGLGGGKGGKNGMFGAGLSPGAGNGTSASAMRPALAPATPAAAPAAPSHPSTGGASMSTSPAQFAPYTVQSGDTLWDIAERTTGSGSNWQSIYDANKDVIGGDPNLIMPGQQLHLSSSGQSLPQTR